MGRESDNPIVSCIEERSGSHEQRTDALLHEQSERCIQFCVIVRPAYEQLLIDRLGGRFEILQLLNHRRELWIEKYAD